jgi:hypothetical protein
MLEALFEDDEELLYLSLEITMLLLYIKNHLLKMMINNTQQCIS